MRVFCKPAVMQLLFNEKFNLLISNFLSLRIQILIAVFLVFSNQITPMGQANVKRFLSKEKFP